MLLKVPWVHTWLPQPPTTQDTCISLPLAVGQWHSKGKQNSDWTAPNCRHCRYLYAHVHDYLLQWCHQQTVWHACTCLPMSTCDSSLFSPTWGVYCHSKTDQTFSTGVKIIITCTLYCFPFSVHRYNYGRHRKKGIVTTVSEPW